MNLAIKNIADDFALLDDWEDRYRYIIELGQGLPPFPDELRDDAHKVHGCVSQVWLNVTHGPGNNPVMNFQGDSDAHIVRGLVAILIALFSELRAADILTTEAEETMRDLGLIEHLTPQRSNGLRSMIRRIKDEARRAMSDSARVE